MELQPPRPEGHFSCWLVASRLCLRALRHRSAGFVGRVLGLDVTPLDLKDDVGTYLLNYTTSQELWRIRQKPIEIQRKRTKWNWIGHTLQGHRKRWTGFETAIT